MVDSSSTVVVVVIWVVVVVGFCVVVVVVLAVVAVVVIAAVVDFCVVEVAALVEGTVVVVVFNVPEVIAVSVSTKEAVVLVGADFLADCLADAGEVATATISNTRAKPVHQMPFKFVLLRVFWMAGTGIISNKAPTINRPDQWTPFPIRHTANAAVPIQRNH